MDSQLSEDQFHEDDQSRAKWTTSSTKIFADLLVEQILQGNRSNNVFNRKAWKYVRAEFNELTGLKFDRQQLKNHLDVLRKRYNYVKTLLDQIGFRLDESRCVVIAKDEVWEKYLEAHPEADAIRKKGCPIYKQLCTIFSESGTDGKYALSDSRTAMHQMGQDQSRAKWSTSLEQIFADLMLEQVLQGNRSNHAFNKKAWKYIRDEFNKQTGLNFDKQQLKNRHGVLRRLYINVKSLLDQSGFSWDRSHSMVIAKNEVWVKYIEEHPENEIIKTKGCPLYEKLSRIFSESGDEVRYAPSYLLTTTPQMDSQHYLDESKEDQSRAKWTSSLDKIFVDLLVEQAQKNSISNKKAWKCIRDEFNKHTGLNFDEQQLRNHQSVLRRWYNNIKLLLDQRGFSWDKSQDMVIAEDEMWKNYVKAHPEADTIRNKGCPIYTQLCLIFSESGIHGKCSHLRHGIKMDEEETVRTETSSSWLSISPETASMSADPLPVSAFVQDEASSRSVEEENVSDGHNKRQFGAPLSSGRHKRVRVGTSHAFADAMLTMASATKLRAATFAHSVDQFSISSCINVLNGMQDVDQGLYLTALDVFQDPNQRETFMSIRSDVRLAWLKSKSDAHS